MALYFLEYDLRKDRDYQRLYDELEKFHAIRILQSLWCFNRTGTDCAKLRDYFLDLIDSDDGLIVSEVNTWASINTLANPKQLT